jgi:hypothetical protein
MFLNLPTSGVNRPTQLTLTICQDDVICTNSALGLRAIAGMRN